MEREELGDWLRLALTPGVGNSAARKLLAAFGLPTQIFSQGREALTQVVSANQADALRKEPADLAAHLDIAWEWLADGAATAPRHVLTLADAAYPPALLQTEDPPLLLYAIGTVPAPWPAGIAVVGSRNPTPQGRTNALRFGRALAEAGLTVVSGLALGIDTAAHEGALEGAAPGQLATVAVVGTGLDRVYPSSNLALAHRIAERGLLLSEYALGTPALPENFPKRNRLIAGLGLGTLVVEAALKSGSLITARLASEQGKDVFAVPGSIHSTQARGCHALLKQGAKLVETAQDVLEELRWQAPVPANAPANAPDDAEPSAAAPESALLAALGFDPVGLDALVARTGIPASQLQVQLLEFELAGEVSRLPGGLFQRMGTA
ncbi:DNA-processing protein DprA [Ramlibacter sp.]|uniref:DNA-processing protein DprA n=1 Tax=Ramlibacter sp. TaxID=1917967 RepID=UPI0017ECBC9C|nr:DNA-processing protein DprA [Ramlibacter sp.]MBA2673083.1 DNA-protecting protein DprA [Ramlibacter sp.]